MSQRALFYRKRATHVGWRMPGLFCVFLTAAAMTPGAAAQRLTVDDLWTRTQALQATVDRLALGGLPVGAIVMWSGSLDSVPAGWALCDGSNGRPDLRGRFVRGASAAVAPHVSGGATNHAHPALSHTHPLGHVHAINASEIGMQYGGLHYHSSEPPVGPAGTWPFTKDPPGLPADVWSYFPSHRHDTSGPGGANYVHSHLLLDLTGTGLQVDRFGGSTDDVEKVLDDIRDFESAAHIPPYVAQVFIMKVSAGN